VEHALKQRLVGAAVIIALGIIFIPMLLDGAGERQLRKIPPAPKPRFVSSPGFVVEDKVADRGGSKTSEIVLRLPEERPVRKKEVPKRVKKPLKIITRQAPAVTAIKKKPAKVTKEIKSASIPVVSSRPAMPKTPSVADRKPDKVDAGPWVVQVGSFTDAKKAFMLRDRLRKKKYKAFVEKVKGRTGQKMYRVRVGPLYKRNQIDSLSKKLKTEGVKGFVTRYL